MNADDLEDEDAQKAIEEKYEDDEEDVNAFFEYAATECGEVPAEIPSE